MLVSALIAYIHFLALFAVAATLLGELLLHAREMSVAQQRLLLRIDLLYLFGAIAIVATGILRVFTSPKGAAFYGANPTFWLMIALFALVGMLSIPPTRHYLHWRPALERGEAAAIGAAAYARTRACLVSEIGVFALIPFVASLMARGVGLHLSG